MRDVKPQQKEEEQEAEDKIFQATLDHLNQIWNNPAYDLTTKRIMINKIIPIPFPERLIALKSNDTPPETIVHD